MIQHETNCEAAPCDAGVEYHYAPVSGGIVCMSGGAAEKIDGWPGHHALMARFLALRESGEIVLLRTENYGHQLFHGHSGRVDIYGSPDAGKFTFVESTWVYPGRGETEAGKLGSGIHSSAVALKNIYPEIAEWSDLATYLAWDSFCSHLLIGNMPSNFERTDDFLNYLCWRQTRGDFPMAGVDEIMAASKVGILTFTRGFELLAQAVEWKSTSK